MKEKLLSRHGEESHALIFKAGDEVISTLTDFVRRRRVRAAHFTGIGALSSATLAYFDWKKKDYIKIPITEQVEVLVLAGDVAWEGNKPVVHAHIVLGCRDGSTRGGHLLRAIVRPTLELMFSQAGALARRHDPQSGLALIAPDHSTARKRKPRKQ